jgi:hypothetical protein
MKICFVTALFGNAEKLDKPGKFKRIPNHDYILFTDMNPACFDTSWEVINIQTHSVIKKLESSVRRSRYPKFMGWEIFDNIGRRYDAIFYCDAFLSPNINTNWTKYGEKLIQTTKEEAAGLRRCGQTFKNFGFMQTLHKRDVVVQGGIEVEMQRIVEFNKDTEENIEKTRAFFKKNDKTVDLTKSGHYCENTTFGYDPNSEFVRTLTSEFWKFYTTENITYRDQPLWNFFMLKYKVDPILEYGFCLYSPDCDFLHTGKLGTHDRSVYT